MSRTSIRRIAAMTAILAVGALGFSAPAHRHHPVMKVLYSFHYQQTTYAPGGYAPGGARLIRAHNGSLFGTTNSGGTYGDGVVFELGPPAKRSGKSSEKVLLNLSGNAKDGSQPQALAAFGRSLFGTTRCCGPNNDGVVFELTPRKGRGGWKENVLKAFFSYSSPGFANGSSPSGTLAFDSKGNLYGSTTDGGSGTSFGNGLVYKLVRPAHAGGKWKEVVLYRFKGKPDGVNPDGGIIRASNRSIYGTTNAGGIYDKGTVFRLTRPASGKPPWNRQILHSFKGGKDGMNPGGNGVTIDRSGNLFGMTSQGGIKNNGVVFELKRGSKGYSESVLYRFPSVCSYCTDVTGAQGGLTRTKKGVLFGTTSGGGRKQSGTVFRLSPPGKHGKRWIETNLWTFDLGIHFGGAPEAGLTRTKKGVLYGTVNQYGPGKPNPGGTVFKLKP